MGQDRHELSAYWEQILAKEGMPAKLRRTGMGKRIVLGDGLGNKTEDEEQLEDSGDGHSHMCPINLGLGLSDEIDQPNDRPVEAAMIDD